MPAVKWTPPLPITKPRKRLTLPKRTVCSASWPRRCPTVTWATFGAARVNSALDPETDKGVAKPFYEKTIEVLDAKGDGDPRIYIECYSYLGYYYYVKEDIENSKIYWEKILAIDPTNEIANRAMSGLK